MLWRFNVWNPPPPQKAHNLTYVSQFGAKCLACSLEDGFAALYVSAKQENTKTAAVVGGKTALCSMLAPSLFLSDIVANIQSVVYVNLGFTGIRRAGEQPIQLFCSLEPLLS